MYICNMQMITTTELRTKSKKLVKSLNEGKSVDLIHRSKIVAEIRPKTQVKFFDFKKIEDIVKKLNLPYLTDREIENRYRKTMEEKHVKGLS